MSIRKEQRDVKMAIARRVYCEGTGNVQDAARAAGVGCSTVKDWARKGRWKRSSGLPYATIHNRTG